MPFEKGKSGNPGGRPKQIGDLKVIAREKTAQAIATLVQVMSNRKSPAAARVTAACALLDRGYGRPIQMTELTGKDQGPIELTNATDLEVARRLAYFLQLAAESEDEPHATH